MNEPCKKCGEPGGDCYAPETVEVSGIYCRLGQIARQLERLNDFLASEKEEDTP